MVTRLLALLRTLIALLRTLIALLRTLRALLATHKALLARCGFSIALGWYLAFLVYMNLVPFRSTPPDLPAAFRSKFMEIGYHRIGATVGGLVLLRSPLLKREFPDYVFVKRRIWRPGVNGMRTFAISPSDPRIWEFQKDTWEFFIHTRRRILTEQDAERLRRLEAELYPGKQSGWGYWSSSRHKRVAALTWRLSIMPIPGGTAFHEVHVDREGFVMSDRLDHEQVD